MVKPKCEDARICACLECSRSVKCRNVRRAFAPSSAGPALIKCVERRRPESNVSQRDNFIAIEFTCCNQEEKRIVSFVGGRVWCLTYKYNISTHNIQLFDAFTRGRLFLINNFFGYAQLSQLYA